MSRITRVDAMMSLMRSTVRIDDDLMAELKRRARQESLSLTRMLNRLLRKGLQASGERSPRKKRYREKTLALGSPRVDLDKALALAARLEDEEILRKVTLRK
jgi:Arc/MetJ family transcription regulator